MKHPGNEKTKDEERVEANADMRRNAKDIQMGIMHGSNVILIQRAGNRHLLHSTSVLTTSTREILTQADDLMDDLEDDPEIEAMEQEEEDPTKMATADDPEAGATDWVQEEDQLKQLQPMVGTEQ